MGASSGLIQETVETLRGSIVRRPDQLRAYALDAVQRICEADAAAWYQLGMVDGNPHPVRWQLAGMKEHIFARHLEERLPYPQGDPRLADARSAGRFVLLRAVLGDAFAGFQSTSIYQRCWEPDGINDQLRMVVHHERRFAGFIGAFRKVGAPHFDHADTRRVAPLARVLADALITSDRIECARTPGEACDILLDPAGRVDYASSEGRLLLQRHEVRDQLRLWVHGVDTPSVAMNTMEEKPIISGHHVRWSRLEGEGRVRYLVHLERVAPVELHPAFELSRTQQKVARLACSGSSVSEIAERLMVSPETVRTHLKQVYRILGVTTRTELATKLAHMPNEVRQDS